MAASHLIEITPGNDVRTAMTLVDTDGLDTVIASGSSIGLTIATDLNGVEVDAAAIVAYTSTEDQTPEEFLGAFCNLIEATISARASFTENRPDKFVVHVVGVGGVTNGIVLSLPTIAVT